MPGSSTGSSSSNEGRIARRRRRTTPCGACRVLRRRCTPMCSFSRYFRPHEASRFRAFNLVFGANSYTLGLIRGFPALQRRRAFRVLVQEAHIRLQDPINGCIGVIEDLERQLAVLRADCDAMVIRNRLCLRILFQREASRLGVVRQPPAIAHEGNDPEVY